MKFIRVLKAEETKYTIWAGTPGNVEEVLAENLTEQGVVDWTRMHFVWYMEDCRNGGDGFYYYVNVKNIEDAKLALKEIFDYALSPSNDLTKILNLTNKSDKEVKQIFVRKRREPGHRGEIVNIDEWTDEDWMRTGQ